MYTLTSLQSLALNMEESSVSTRVLSILIWSMLAGWYGVHAGIQSSKIVVMPLPVVSSQYFNMLEIAEEMARRGNEVPIITFACIFSLLLVIALRNSIYMGITEDRERSRRWGDHGPNKTMFPIANNSIEKLFT